MFSVTRLIQKPGVQNFIQNFIDSGLTKLGHFLYLRYRVLFSIAFKALDFIEARR